MAPLTSTAGFDIREINSGIKEKEICDAHGLEQMGGSQTKIDGTDGTNNKSIKNASGSSTQVHLTTQNAFINALNLDVNSQKFVRLFCGNQNLNINGVDRYNCKQIDSTYIDSFKNFLDENKEKVVDYIVRNGFDITHVVFNNTKKNKEYELTYEEIIAKIENAEWVFLKGGVHLKLQGEMKKNGKGRKRGKTIFHFQREGKRKMNDAGEYTQRYNVLWHIHRNLFTC